MAQANLAKPPFLLLQGMSPGPEPEFGLMHEWVVPRLHCWPWRQRLSGSYWARHLKMGPPCSEAVSTLGVVWFEWGGKGRVMPSSVAWPCSLFGPAVPGRRRWP